ncbi:MAG: hypothetical protein V7673_04490 [Paracoccus sp. (in: a-proteobacteria)]|uniref:hypothetical protein n=1 Tax=Paracoccus sp. TaxID=267 RepID=UPI003001D154
MTRPFRRITLYLPGFDPFPARRYREIYRRESAAQAAISGYRIRLRPGVGIAGYGWHVQASFPGARIRSQVEVLPWADLVRSSMRGGVIAPYLQLARTAWIYAASGTLSRLVRLRKGPVLAILYPVGVLVLQMLSALLLAWLAAWLVGGIAGLVAGLVLAWLTLLVFRRLDHLLYARYLMHDFAFAAQHRGAYAPALETRLDHFTDRLRAALTQDVDEVLVVGHSSGAYLAVSVVADLLRRSPGHRPALSLLTLGHVVPMVSLLPRADRLRADLALLSESPAIFWLDVSAPGDACCFGLCDPVAVSGVAGPDQRWPLVISAAFSRTLLPGTRRRLRGRWFRLHFQYLHAFDRPDGYDYFAITAGPLTLAQRYGGRGHSPGRIAKPVGRRA